MKTIKLNNLTVWLHCVMNKKIFLSTYGKTASHCWSEDQILSHPSSLLLAFLCYLHWRVWAGYLVPGTTILNFNKTFSAIQHRAGHILVHDEGTPVSAEEQSETRERKTHSYQKTMPIIKPFGWVK